LTIITKVKRAIFLSQCTEVNMNTIMIKISQGSVVTQTVLGG